MKSRHIDLHSEYEKKHDTAKGKEKASSSSRQLTLQESSDKTQKWDINDPRAHKIHTRIGEMIALDYQPFSIVDDIGFIHLLCPLEPKKIYYRNCHAYNL